MAMRLLDKTSRAESTCALSSAFLRKILDGATYSHLSRFHEAVTVKDRLRRSSVIDALELLQKPRSKCVEIVPPPLPQPEPVAVVKYPGPGKRATKTWVLAANTSFTDSVPDLKFKDLLLQKSRKKHEKAIKFWCNLAKSIQKGFIPHTEGLFLA